MTTLTTGEYLCLEKIFLDNNVCSSHGIDHARTVMENTFMCCESRSDITLHDIGNICVAGFLHDADDRKFFPNNKNYENAHEVLKNRDLSDIEQIINMISKVSASSNKDYHDVNVDESFYYPRYSDRLESIGHGGIKRCFQYTKTTGTKLHVPYETPLCFTKEDILKAMSDRYLKYTGSSASMIDHYYDKLLYICTLPDWIHNKYLINEFAKRQHAMFDFIIYYSNAVHNTGKFTDDDVITFIQ